MKIFSFDMEIENLIAKYTKESMQLQRKHIEEMTSNGALADGAEYAKATRLSGIVEGLRMAMDLKNQETG